MPVEANLIKRQRPEERLKDKPLKRPKKKLKAKSSYSTIKSCSSTKFSSPTEKKGISAKQGSFRIAGSFNKGINKRSQLSLFLIIGVSFLIISVILFSFNAKEDIDKGAGQKLHSYSKKAGYDSYVTSCLKQLTQQAVYLLSMQGGVLYDGQIPHGKAFLGPPAYPYGRYILPVQAKEKLFNVSYIITKPETRPKSTCHPSVPFYPLGMKKLSNDPENCYNVLGNYPPPGPMPPLCDSNGENSKKLGSKILSCESYDTESPFDHNSVQEYLKEYIKAKLPSCLNYSPKINSSGLSANITVNITFGESDFLVKARLPVFVSEREDTIRLKEFSYLAKIRLKQIHELIEALIKKDTNDIFFNIVSDAGSLKSCRDLKGSLVPCLKDGMRVYKLRDICLGSGRCTEGNYDDVLVVEDFYSSVFGEPLVFQGAIENRAPALDYIAFPSAEDGFDIVAKMGDKITIEPVAYDPDEDFHNENGSMDRTYYYSMWKETSDQFFDYASYRLCSKGFLSNCPTTLQGFVRNRNKKPLAWSSSEEYKKTKRAASYTTTKEDLGEHMLKVAIADNEGLTDYQILKIKVIPKNGVVP